MRSPLAMSSSLLVPWAVRGLHLCEAAVHKQFRSRDVAAVVGCEKHHGLRDLIGCTELPSGTLLEIIFKRCWPVSAEASKVAQSGRVDGAWLTAFTRMRRSFRSVVHVRANERTAANSIVDEVAHRQTLRQGFAHRGS